MDKTAIQNLKHLYQSRINGLTDEFSRARAQVALSAWEAAEIQYQEVLEASATSYSTSGRSVTKREIDRAIMARNQARMDLDGEVGGPDAGMILVDNGGFIQ